MAVVALISIGCAFIFVTRIYSSKEVFDIPNADATIVDDTSNIPKKNIEAKPEKKKEEAKKVKSENTEKGKDSGIDNDKKGNGIMGSILVPMDSIVVNLGSVDSRRYLRVIINLEVKNDEIQKMILGNKVIFRDKLVSYLSTKNAKEIETQASQLKMRSEIKDILNELLGISNAVKQVYFSDFIVQ
ncbi:MAG: flagellar basal body-associated protein FliL [Candidatus Scalindua rubra]|uniref:Flagellar protein FliL n=1 Tax=Candidatus Scalindua rubra TaxID=1872076 RepID=A0A1E3X4X9_9BACT|nr:MAG: flagellar basal body-associated protein FliL [Candidatus Scalindua rubra]